MLMAFCVHQASAQGFLKASNKTIVDGTGKEVILRGMGLGGWMLQEGYMFRLSFIGQQYRIAEKISDVVGPEKTALFYNRWLHEHTTRADIDSMAAWGFNSIRLPMHYRLFTEGYNPAKPNWKAKGFQLTDSLLAWCKANRLYLILDMHAAPGGQGNDLPISDRNPAWPSLWENPSNQDTLNVIWQHLATRYANEPWIGGYDLMNEPNWGFEDPKNDFRGIGEKTNAPLKALLVRLTKTVREVDKNHLIIIEGNGFGNNYNGLLPAWDDNMALSFHKYGNFNNTGAIQGFLQLRDEYNLPLWLGESGENSNTWFTQAIQLAEASHIGWAWWQEKKMGINNPLEIRMPANYQVLLDYWNGKGPKPSEAEAWKILQELLNNIQLKNNVPHPDVVDAMFRQVRTTETKPFASHLVTNAATIQAVDFDLGRQGFAYYDKDSASYQYTPGVNTVGNKGRTYRNDGVDIQQGARGPEIFSIEEGEWLRYSITVPKEGVYQLSLSFSKITRAAAIEVSINEGEQKSSKELSADTSPQGKIVTHNNLRLAKGRNTVLVKFNGGGMSFHGLELKRMK